MKSVVKTKNSDKADIPLIERKLSFGPYKGHYIREVPVKYFVGLLQEKTHKPSVILWAKHCIEAVLRYEKKQEKKHEVAFFDAAGIAALTAGPSPPPVILYSCHMCRQAKPVETMRKVNEKAGVYRCLENCLGNHKIKKKARFKFSY